MRNIDPTKKGVKPDGMAYKSYASQRDAMKAFEEKTDTIKFRVPKGYGEVIKEYAKEHYGTLNNMMVALIKKEIGE